MKRKIKHGRKTKRKSRRGANESNRKKLKTTLLKKKNCKGKGRKKVSDKVKKLMRKREQNEGEGRANDPRETGK